MSVLAPLRTPSWRSGLELLHECEFLSIEDILPSFPDVVVIDEFKVGLCCVTSVTRVWLNRCVIERTTSLLRSRCPLSILAERNQ